VRAAVKYMRPLPEPPDELEILFREQHARIFRTAYRITGSAVDAEDVLQNVFLRLMNNRVTLDAAWSPEQYLRRAATNASIDLLRRKTWRAETEIHEELDYGTGESTVLLKERLRRALAKLPPEDAELFVLCYLEGYTYDELAEQFKLERGTVASRLHRIRTVLQKHLTK
jgi:RNA polymerase sigma-70 factor, ECF subfamily